MEVDTDLIRDCEVIIARAIIDGDIVEPLHGHAMRVHERLQMLLGDINEE